MKKTGEINDLYSEALKRFGALQDEAAKTDMIEPTAMHLATADADGRPSVRTMLLKGFDERGFVFYTNRDSRKGQELEDNPNASLCFFWRSMMRQVRIDGPVVPVSDDESDSYWATRPRESQLGAWASEQSRIIESRALLEKKLEECREHYRDQDIPRPPYWSGFRVVPNRIEFWESIEYRLHNREVYEKTDAGWVRYLLNP